MSKNRDEVKVYVGDLPKDANEKEIEKAFKDFGPIKSVWVARNPAGFAFVMFDDYRDAEDAVKELDGSVICGVRVRVEMSHGRSRPKPWASQSRNSRHDHSGDYREKRSSSHNRHRSRSISRGS